MIRFVFYAPRLELFAKEIAHIKSLLVSYDTEVLVLNNRTELLCLITSLCKEKNVVILFASSNEELEDMVKIKERFGSIPTVLVLPDENIETCQKGMLLNPLYFMTKQDNLRHFSLAINELSQMYEDHNNKATPYSLFN